MPPASLEGGSDALATIHEAGGFGLVGTRRTAFQLLRSIALCDEALGATGNFGNVVGPVMLDDRIQRGFDRRHRTDLLHQRVFGGDSSWLWTGLPASS